MYRSVWNNSNSDSLDFEEERAPVFGLQIIIIESCWSNEANRLSNAAW